MKKGMALADDDEFVPADYNELFAHYYSQIVRQLRRLDRIGANFDDLVQHTSVKIVEVDLLKKYHASTGNQARQLTGEQVALYLKMTWNQFKVFMWRAHMGDKRPEIQNSVMSKILGRDSGVCHSAVAHRATGGMLDTVEYARSLRVLQTANPAEYKKQRKDLKKRFGISEKTWRFWDVEVADEHARGAEKYKTVCLFCQVWKREAAQTEAKRSRSSIVLTPVKGTRGSKAALYDIVDVEKVRIQREESKRCKEQPNYPAFQVPQTKSRFKLYLARAVHNTWANWCRTRSRKYKELYLGPSEEGQAWESFLEDDGRNDPEAKMIVTEEVNENIDKVADKLRKKISEGKISREQIEDYVSRGYTLSEIIREFNLPRAVLQVVTNRYG